MLRPLPFLLADFLPVPVCWAIAGPQSLWRGKPVRALDSRWGLK